MNKERILKLADVVEQQESQNLYEAIFNGFDMRAFVTSSKNEKGYYCTAPACIAGWAVYTFALERFGGAIGHITGREVLGLTNQQALDLFSPTSPRSNYLAKPGARDYIKPKQAAAVLRHFAFTGKIDWDRFAHLSHEDIAKPEFKPKPRPKPAPKPEPKTLDNIRTITPAEDTPVKAVASDTTKAPDWVDDTLVPDVLDPAIQVALTSDALEPEEKAQLKFRKNTVTEGDSK